MTNKFFSLCLCILTKYIKKIEDQLQYYHYHSNQLDLDRNRLSSRELLEFYMANFLYGIELFFIELDEAEHL